LASGSNPHDMKRARVGVPFAVGQGRRNPRASGRPSAPPPPDRRVVKTFRSGRGPTVSAAHPPRAQWWSRCSGHPGSSRLVYNRCSVLWTGVEPVTSRVSAWCSTSELPRPGPAPVSNPCTEHTPPIVSRRGECAAGPTGPAACFRRDAGGSRTHFGPGCGRSPGRLAPASFSSRRECPRQESNLAFDLRKVACLRHTPRTKYQQTSVPPPGVEPGLRPSESRVPSVTLQGQDRTSRGARIRTLCAGFGSPLLSQEHTPRKILNQADWRSGQESEESASGRSRTATAGGEWVTATWAHQCPADA
jgi:hypothetical protein